MAINNNKRDLWIFFVSDRNTSNLWNIHAKKFKPESNWASVGNYQSAGNSGHWQCVSFTKHIQG